MINPITEMKVDITTANVLKAELHSKLRQKTKAVKDFYQAKEKAEQISLPQPTIEPPSTPKFSVMADKEKEAQLLKMAKERYQNYNNVAEFAKELGLRPGIVYLTLKHHGFIAQNESTQYRVLDSYYRNNGNLKLITDDTGLSVWICAKTLESMELSANWNSYRETIAKNSIAGQGADGEMEFKRLVPGAVDMNGQYQANNPAFDFLVGETTIDVKTGKLRTLPKRGGGWYEFKILSQELPDYYAFFALKDSKKPLTAGNYHLFLIPSIVIPEGASSVRIGEITERHRNHYWDFEIEPVALAAMLEDI